MLLFWIFIFILSLATLLKSTDWLLESAKRLGYAFGISPFVVGVVIIGFGTSAPELASSIAAVIRGVPDVVAANAIGSNIANILLVMGISVIIARMIVVSKNLIDLELPLLALATTLFVGVAYDGEITRLESVLLVVSYGVYLLYTLRHQDETTESAPRARFLKRDGVFLVLGLLGLVFGAKYLIDAIIRIAEIAHIGTALIAATAVAVGTSLPELLVSIKAALQKDFDIAIGNIFGSNAFNILMVIGIPGILTSLPVEGVMLSFGLPALVAVTLLFIFSTISKKIYIWEGLMFLVLYFLFAGKLLGIF